MKFILITLMVMSVVMVSVRCEEDDDSDQDCECDRMLFPVCASDGKTYPNICVMECENKEKTPKVTKVRDGRC